MVKRKTIEHDELAYLKLVYLRAYLNINQKKFVKILNEHGVKLSYWTYTKYETNVCKPPKKFIDVIATIYSDNEVWLKTGEGNISCQKRDRAGCELLSILFRLEYAMRFRGKEEEELAFGLHLKKQEVIELLKTGKFKTSDENKVITIKNDYLQNAITKLLGLSAQWLIYGKGSILEDKKD